MSVFVVLSRTKNTELGNIIQEIFPNDLYKLSDDQWLISTQGTARELSDKIGISDKGKNLSAIVFSVSGYWGKASTDIWDWIRSRWEKDDG